MFHKLDSETVKKEEKKNILCVDFQKFYREKYLPTVVEHDKLLGVNDSQKQYELDLKIVTRDYSKSLKISCASEN
ncbi:hypothetical protein [Acinetobacter sp. ANC 4648]|uniref:hypothetical protein n=1 Tax=Acinetobacter sp. ANC 4648 TaxID=1977875 RepID=UPI000A347FF3|nr:hypothetical protein [Acinetobacter sp. ANC 4648]OTG82197.1 hypothetical protein B9T27_08060 [Acinetobacter sp. ANC 4648]